MDCIEKVPSIPEACFLISEKHAENLQGIFISIFRLRRKLPPSAAAATTFLGHHASPTWCYRQSTYLVTNRVQRRWRCHLPFSEQQEQHEPAIARNHSHPTESGWMDGWLAVRGRKWGNNKAAAQAIRDNLFSKGSIIHGNVAPCAMSLLFYRFLISPATAAPLRRWLCGGGGLWLTDRTAR